MENAAAPRRFLPAHAVFTLVAVFFVAVFFFVVFFFLAVFFFAVFFGVIFFGVIAAVVTAVVADVVTAAVDFTVIPLFFFFGGFAGCPVFPVMFFLTAVRFLRT